MTTPAKLICVDFKCLNRLMLVRDDGDELPLEELYSIDEAV